MPNLKLQEAQNNANRIFFLNKINNFDLELFPYEIDMLKDREEKSFEEIEEHYKKIWPKDIEHADAFRTFWKKYTDKYISSYRAKALIEADYALIAKKMYKELLRDCSDSITMLTYAYTCEKIDSNVFLMISTFKLHASMIEVITHKLTKKHRKNRDIKIYDTILSKDLEYT